MFGKKKKGMPLYETPPPMPPLPKRKLKWYFATLDSNFEVRDFLNSNGIEPEKIYETSTGRIVVWYKK